MLSGRYNAFFIAGRAMLQSLRAAKMVFAGIMKRSGRFSKRRSMLQKKDPLLSAGLNLL